MLITARDYYFSHHRKTAIKLMQATNTNTHLFHAFNMQREEICTSPRGETQTVAASEEYRQEL